MHDADEREAFLKAIFDAPDDDLPRLVFADWLDERGESDWAELIRMQCQIATTLEARARERELIGQLFPGAGPQEPFERGFLQWKLIAIAAETLDDLPEFRRIALLQHPEWYGAAELKIVGGIIHSGKAIQTILINPITARVARLDFSGSIVHLDRAPPGWRVAAGPLLTIQDEYEYRPVVTVQAVEALVNSREARRLTHLDLRNNDLDNDAARAIVNSKNLIRLQSLHLFDGNQLRGRTWQQLLERFGPEVVQ